MNIFIEKFENNKSSYLQKQANPYLPALEEI